MTAVAKVISIVIHWEPTQSSHVGVSQKVSQHSTDAIKQSRPEVRKQPAVAAIVYSKWGKIS